MTDNIEELSTRLVLDADPFLTELEAALAKGESQVNASTDQMVKRLREGFEGGGAGAKDWAHNVKGATDETSTFGNILQRITGDVGKFVSGLAAGLTVLAGLQKIYQFFRESEAAAISASQANLQFEAQIIVLQHSIGEAAGTIAEYTEFIDRLSDAYGVSAIQTKVASVSFLQAANAVGLTKDQIMAAIEAATIFAQATGNTVPEALNAFNRFLQYGSSIALKRLGVDLADVQAQVGKTFAEMSETDRIEALNVILQQMSGYSDTLAQSQGFLAQRQQRVNKEFEDAKVILGNIFTPALLTLKEVFADLTTGIVSFAKFMATYLAIANAALAAFVAAGIAGLLKFTEFIRNGTIPDLKAVGAEMVSVFQGVFHAVGEQNLATISGAFQHLQDDFEDTGAAAGQMSAEVKQAMNEVTKAIEEGQKDWEEGLAKAQQSFRDAVANILLDSQRARFDAATKLSRDLRDIDANAGEDRLKTIRDAQVEEKRLREDFQRQLRDLETKYLFELEDAVRERDARQVLLLMRRFNLEKAAATDDFSVKQKRLREDTKFELAEIERRRQIARQQRIIAYQEELADIELQKRRKFEDAQRNYQNELRDLQEAIRRRIELLIQGFIAEGRLTHDALLGIYNQYKQMLGPGGLIEGLYRYFSQAVQRYNAAISAYSARLTGLAGYYAAQGQQGTGGGGGGRTMRAYQRGGEFIATSPTAVMTGEGRPERVSVTPLSGAMAGGFGGEGQKAKIELNVTLDSGLEAKLVDRAMNETAEVVLSITRSGGDEARR